MPEQPRREGSRRADDGGGDESRASTSTARRPLLAVLLVLALFYASAHLLTGRYTWARAVAWLESDIGDQHRFPERTVPAGDRVSALPRGP